MLDLIQLLPDSVANQIAAGEVIQRPASAVKELLENAIDAGSTRIKLYLKDAGKTLIQVIDDGSGMSVLDARLCFERHATSKIRSVDDLFTLYTMGFRGEALASVAAIAQVEMKTRRHNEDIGTQIIIEGSEVVSQEPCACNAGTTINIKNLFYNVPARRNFLKSNTVETRHIVEEFTRVALAHPQIAFNLVHNDATIYDLKAANLRQRISSVFGIAYNERLVPVEEETSIVKLEGFVGKPEFAKKVRGEQYFFVNKRFIKNAYLNHAVTAAFENLIAKDCYASYFINIEIDPASIDVNIHPTKTEIKFENEKAVYAILRAAVKRALGKFSVAPTIDFEQEKSFDIPLDKMDERPVAPTIRVSQGYNPFMPKQERTETAWKPLADKIKVDRWQQLNRDIEKSATDLSQTSFLQYDANVVDVLPRESFIQVYQQYILISTLNGLLVIDQQGAHERILFERFLKSYTTKNAPSQQQLFPQPLEFTPAESVLLDDLLPVLHDMGFDIASFGANTFVLHGAPDEVIVGTEKKLLHAILDKYIQQGDNLEMQPGDKLALSIACQLSIKKGQSLSSLEMKRLVTDLFKCDNTQYSPLGKPIVKMINNEIIANLFNQ